jgi:hypothetical protein
MTISGTGGAKARAQVARDPLAAEFLALDPMQVEPWLEKQRPGGVWPILLLILRVLAVLVARDNETQKGK